MCEGDTESNIESARKMPFFDTHRRKPDVGLDVESRQNTCCNILTVDVQGHGREARIGTRIFV